MSVAPPRLVLHRGLATCLVATFVLLPVALYFLNDYWPYRYRMVEPTLEKVFASQIKMEQYHRTYFPYPGFVADGLTLRRNSAPDLPPVGSVDHVRVEGSWLDLLLLRRRIDRVYADGLHIVIPPVGSRANREDFPPGSSSDFEGPSTVIGKLVMEHAIFEILRTDGSRYSFPIWSLVMTHLQQNSAVGYTLDLQTPFGGSIAASGSFGPLRGGQLAQTPVTGQFTYQPLKLDGISHLHGTLSSRGNFHGNLGEIEAEAQYKVDRFSVNRGHPVMLTGDAAGGVNALNGDVLLHQVDVSTGQTEVHALGQIAGAPKVIDLQVKVAKGRAQDLLEPFMKASSPVVGPVRLHSQVHVSAAQNKAPFLDRLTISGVFEIPQESLTKPSVERSLTALSERAQGVSGDDAAHLADEHDVLSSLHGAVLIRHGVAHASRLVFEVPGASVEVNGTFDLRDQTVNMRGDLRMQSDISHITTGFRSFLLKPLAPFFKKQGAGAVVPVKVTGGPGQYKVGQDIFH